MPYYLGIDGGGSKTTCALGDETSVLATITTGPSNIVRVGEARARESLSQCVRQACAAAGIMPAQISGACIGAAGAARPKVAASILGILKEIIPSSIEVVGDTEIALHAAFGAGSGVVVIAGTGSIAYGRNATGATARAGGWGFAISDEGSAHWIGRTAISTILRAHDLESTVGKSHSEVPAPSGFGTRTLKSEILKKWGLESIEGLVRAANSMPAPDFSALFPVVLSAAESGDSLAVAVLARAGTELASLAELVIRRLFLQNGVPVSNSPAMDGITDSGTVPLAMVGGVFRHASQVRDAFYNEIRRMQLGAELKREVVDPVTGALELARKARP